MNSNLHHQPSHFNPQRIDGSPIALDGSQSVLEMEQLHELHRQVAVQQRKLRSLRQQVADASNSHVPSTCEQDAMKLLIFRKERELAMALVKVAELTSQLEHMHCSPKDDDEPSQRILETNSPSLGVAEKIIPISVNREDVHLDDDARKMPRQDNTDAKTTTDENKDVRIIPIVLVSSANQQPQGMSCEKTVSSREHPMNNDDKSFSLVKKENDRFETAGEKKKGMKHIDINENVEDRGKSPVVDLSTDIKNTSSVPIRGKSENALQSSVSDDVDTAIFVTKDSVSKSHSMGDRTDSEQKANCVSKISPSKMDDIDSCSSSSDKDEENRKKIFSREEKSFSDVSLSDQRVGLSEDSSSGSCFVDNAKQFENTEVTFRNGSTFDSAQCQPTNGSSRADEHGFKTDRTRFFMDMAKENVLETGGVHPWKEIPRSPVSSELWKPTGSVVSPSSVTSRGHSSSSAIMSRFAPQPYGRSKSVDSGSLRVPVATTSGAVRRERSPEITVSIAETVPLKSASSYKLPDRHPMTSLNYDHQSHTLKSPAVVYESCIQMPTIVSTAKITPSPLMFKKSISSDDSSSQIDITSTRKSYPEKRVDVPLASSPSGRLLSESRPSTIEISQASSTSVLMEDKVRYSMPLTNGPITVLSACPSSSSSLKVPPSKHEYSSATNNGTRQKTSAVDGKSRLLRRSMSPVSSASCITIESSHSRPIVASGYVQNGLLPQNAKSSGAHVSSSNTTAPTNSKTSQQNLNSLPEHHRNIVDLTSCDAASPAVKPQNRLSSSSLSSSDTKKENLSRPVDNKRDEEFTDKTWDSNVKRLARIYAVKMGETVESGINRDKNRESNYSHGNNKVPLLSNGSDICPTSSTVTYSKTDRNSCELDRNASLLGPALSKLPRQDSLASSSSVETTCSSVRHQQTTQCSRVTEQSSSVVMDSAEQSKVDTSAVSVSSALSVLLKRNPSTTQSSPMRPSRLRSSISSAYRRKLGGGATNNYNQNMTLLYGDSLATRDGVMSSNIQEPPDDVARSPPLQETPPIGHLPHILALNTLDGMPFHPRINSHLRDTPGSNVDNNGMAGEQSTRNELLESGDVELTVISSPKQMADLVQLDPAEGDIISSNSFSPPDDIVSSYIDDPSESDDTRFSSETVTSSPCIRQFPRRTGKPRRHVTFDHISLLLNAALEGEKELVIDIVNKCTNPDQKTETGLGVLHNAVYGSHVDILKYLVEFGCDVNITDNDGWTPLHCAASTNNVEMLRILVESGAGVLPMTISDEETPVQKCSCYLPAYEEAVEYLTGVADSLGVANDGLVYVTSNFTNVCSDELVLCAGETMKILRKGDENESGWWWATNGNAEGYVPQNLLALYPRIQPKWEK